MNDKSPYYTSKSVKDAIDKVLHTNVQIYQNLGVSSTKSEKHAAGVLERANLKSVRELDKEFVDFLIKEH